MSLSACIWVMYIESLTLCFSGVQFMRVIIRVGPVHIFQALQVIFYMDLSHIEVLLNCFLIQVNVCDIYF